ncbi:MAG: methionyl-tRNA formyltransferase [Acidimicrobiales bacterium]
MARLVFLGTPPAAALVLRALVGAGHDVALVVSRPDRRRSRRSPPEPSAVKASALDLGLRVTERAEDAVEAGAELGVVVAFGRIIRPGILERLPMVNLHFSLLPRWRGAAPVERAILAGDARTGVCLMAVEEGLDTGPVYACRDTAIGDEERASELRDRLVAMGTDLLIGRLADSAGAEPDPSPAGTSGPAGTSAPAGSAGAAATKGVVAALGQPRPQTGEPTYAAKIEPSELRLDWERPASDLARVVRVGRAWTTVGGQRLLVLRARAVGAAGPELPAGAVRGLVVTTGVAGLELVEVQPQGRAPMAASDWLRGARLGPDAVLGT